MITPKELSKFSGIRTREEMEHVCADIPDKDLRDALVLVALALNTNIDLNLAISNDKDKEITELKRKVKELEKELQRIEKL